MTYSPITDKDVIQMLKVIKADNIEELFDIIPEEFKIEYNNFSQLL